MALFTPTVIFDRISSITPDFLRENGIKGLILDVDNTLTAHGSQELPPDVEQWLQRMRQAGIKMMIASNNTTSRVEPFAKRVGLDYRAFCCKPSPLGLRSARRAMGVAKEAAALVGDQIYTDSLGANLYGIRMLLVRPMHEDIKPMIRFKRMLEKPILEQYYKKGGRMISAKSDADKLGV